MEKYLKTKFKKFNTEPCIGDNNKFHTVYLITFETGYYYIGKHSTLNLEKDKYFCSGKLALRLKEEGVLYNRKILYYFKSAEDAINAETEILSEKIIYENILCLNCYPGSPPDASGTIIVSKGTKFKMINPKLLNLYLEEGWIQKGIKRVYITNSISNKMVLPNEVDSYLNDGWVLGNSSAKNCIFVEKDGKLTFIKKELLKEFENKGWKYKHNQQGYKVIKKDGKLKKVPEEMLNIFLENGYVLSSTVENLIYIKKDNDYKRIAEDKLNDFLLDGWIKANATSGKIYIFNNITEKRIDISELTTYESQGWKKGRIEKVYLHNNEIEKRFNFNEAEKINHFLKIGFIKGKLKREQGVRIFKDNKNKCVGISVLEKFLNDGWTKVKK